MRVGSRFLLVVALVVGGALPAQAEFVPNTPNERTYFHCSTGQTSQVGNLEGPATWNTTPPADSVTSGAGCGQAAQSNSDTTAPGARVTYAMFTGSYTGNLDRLTVRLDNIYVGGGRLGSPVELTVRLNIDGVDVLGTGGKTTLVTPVPSATRVSDAFFVSVDDIGLMAEKDDKAHTITLAVKSPTTPAQAWVYDTTEVPGGIEFAPAELAPAVISR